MVLAPLSWLVRGLLNRLVANVITGTFALISVREGRPIVRAGKL
jgi:hypothetical protein